MEGKGKERGGGKEQEQEKMGVKAALHTQCRAGVGEP